MNRPLIYISASWSDDYKEMQKEVRKYSRIIYKAGYAPICPILAQNNYLDSKNAIERKDAKDMAKELLRRSRVLVVCGDTYNEEVLEDIALAEKYSIPATSLNGLMDIIAKRVIHKQ